MKISIKDAGRVRVIKLDGRLVIGDGDTELLEALRRIQDEGCSQVVLDLGDLNYLDTTGVATLIICKKRCVAKGGQVKLVMPPGTVYDILVILGLHLAFEIFGDELKAVGSF